MTKLVDWAFARARTVYVLIALVLAGGVYTYTTIPREGSPNIDIPFLYVSVPFPGVSVEDNENLVAKPLEDELSNLTGLEEITSNVTEGHTSVLLQFDINFDKKAAIDNVRAKLDDVRHALPSNIDEPRVLEQNLAEFPVVTIALSGNVPERTLIEVANRLEESLVNLSRVQEVRISGVREEIVEVLIDPLRLESYDTSIAQLLAAVTSNNALVQAGQVETERGFFSVKLSGTFTTVSDIAATPFLTYGERTATFGDIAEIRRTFENPESRARIDGKPAIILEVVKAIGENILKTVDDVQETVATESAAWPKALQSAVRVTPAIDSSVEARRMIDQLENSVATAVVLILILTIALLGIRPAILIGSAIPCSFLMSFCLLSIFGMSINNMVMFGLTLSVGMLIDGAIVVVEYADRRKSEGTPGKLAYHQAAKRMFWPISTSTLTTLCAFLPLLLWPGMSGQFMSQLPLTLIFVLSSSLVVALIFLPVIGAAVQRGALRGNNDQDFSEPSGTAISRGFVARVYRGIVSNPVLPVLCIAGVAGVIAMIAMEYKEHNRGVAFFVDTEPEKAVAYVRARGNLSFEEIDRLVMEAERRTRDIPGIRNRISSSGKGGVGARGNGGQRPRDAIGQIYFEFEEWGRRPNGDDIIAEIVDRTADIPGVAVEINTPNMGPQSGKPISLELRSANWDTLLADASRLRARMESIEGLSSVDDTRPLPGIEWNLEIDRNRANTLGANVIEIGTIVRLLTGGVTIGTYRPRDANDELNIVARFPAGDRVLDTLDNLRLRTETGLVPISSFVSRNPIPAVGSIARKMGERVITISANVDSSYNVNQKTSEVRALLDSIGLSPDVTAELRGELESQNESQEFLIAAFALALLLMFSVLLIQFDSFFAVFLVLVAVVLSVAGVLLGMLVRDQPFSVIMTGIGIVALAGIVVNNNIILIDTYQSLRKHMHELDAIAGAVARRVRPVLLTTVTTMAGLCPMMFAVSVDFLEREILFRQPSALWWVQLSTAIVFGLGFSTLLTLIVTPSALAMRYWILNALQWMFRALYAFLTRSRSERATARAEKSMRRAVWSAYGKNGNEVVWEGAANPEPRLS